MKLLIAALVLSSASLPALAMDSSMPIFTGAQSSILLPGLDEFGRRSGLCPKFGARMVAREGSTCGGV